MFAIDLDKRCDFSTIFITPPPFLMTKKCVMEVLSGKAFYGKCTNLKSYIAAKSFWSKVVKVGNNTAAK